MTPEELTQVQNALIAATEQSAVQSGQAVESSAAQLAPGLAAGSNAPGGYNYQRDMAPVVPALTSQFVTNAKQGAFKGTVRDALNAAQVDYENAKAGYSSRQRAHEVKRAELARQRQAEADARQASYNASMLAASGAGGDGGTGIGDIVVSENDKQYIGSNDVRGRLAWLAAQGDQNAKVALSFVGNDNKYYMSPTDKNYAGAIGALNAVGATNAYRAAPAKGNLPAPNNQPANLKTPVRLLNGKYGVL